MKIYWLNPPLSARSIYADLGWLNFSTVCKDYNWIQPIIDWESYKEVDDIVDHILDSNADILCISTYVWNYILCHKVAERIKEKNNNIIVIQGGPHQGFNSSFFLRHPYVDYVCYATGHGEEFLVEALSQISKYGHIKDPDKVPFLLSQSYRTKTLQSKYVYPLESPLDGNIPYLTQVVGTARQRNKLATLFYDPSRGCPYSCTYCEWGGGTGTKVGCRDTSLVKKDIETAAVLGFNELEFTDANFGIFPRDLELIDYIRECKSVYGYPNNFLFYGLPKVNVNKRERVLDKLLSSGLMDYYFMALQSIKQESLNNVKRPDITLEENVYLANKYRSKYNVPVKVELILGLPGNTLESFYEEMDLFQKFDSWFWPRNIFNVLPDSEAAKPEYQKKHSMVVVDAGVMENEEQDITYISDSVISKFRSNTKIVVETYSFTKEEYKEMYFMNRAQRVLGPMIPKDKLASAELKKKFDIIKQTDWYNRIDQWLDQLVNGKLCNVDTNLIDGKVLEDLVQENIENEQWI